MQRRILTITLFSNFVKLKKKTLYLIFYQKPYIYIYQRSEEVFSEQPFTSCISAISKKYPALVVLDTFGKNKDRKSH